MDPPFGLSTGLLCANIQACVINGKFNSLADGSFGSGFRLRGNFNRERALISLFLRARRRLPDTRSPQASQQESFQALS
jgi:hypothetical protein